MSAKRVTERRARESSEGSDADGDGGEFSAPAAGGTDSARHTFFWQKGSPFSQFHPATYKVWGVTVTCAEQAMMYGKAKLFGDEDSAARILALGKAPPMKYKKLGRGVTGFTEAKWKKARSTIVYQSNVAKFSQVRTLREALDRTAGTTLVEASPRDRIWGIGLGEATARTMPESRWPGLNLLGRALTQVRDDLASGAVAPDMGLEGDAGTQSPLWAAARTTGGGGGGACSGADVEGEEKKGGDGDSDGVGGGAGADAGAGATTGAPAARSGRVHHGSTGSGGGRSTRKGKDRGKRMKGWKDLE